MASVKLWACVNPTEDASKVCEALTRISGIAPRLDDNIAVIYCNHGDLQIFHHLLRDEEILDTARSVLEKGINSPEEKISFMLNKQVAFVGRISFPAGEEELGSIHVEIQCNEGELEDIINWLAPPTEEGKPVYEMEMPPLREGE
jgi:hypothetical protein